MQERVTELLPKLAHVTFEIPTGVSDLKIIFDDRPIPAERLADNFTIDPGTHKVHAEGILRGARVSYDDEKVEVAEGQTVSVKITLKPAALTGGQLECMVAAKTQEEILQCLPSERKPLVVHLGLDMSGYMDTTAVRVLTPGVRASVVVPHGRLERRRELHRRRGDRRVARRRVDGVTPLRTTCAMRRRRPAATSPGASADRSSAATRARATTSRGRSARP